MIRVIKRWLGLGCWCCGRAWEIKSNGVNGEYKWCMLCKFGMCDDCI